MYEQFYHLDSDPFRLSTNGQPGYQHDTYRRAKTYMLYALRQGEGVVLITGKSGIGKTELIQDFIASCRDQSVITSDLISTQLQPGWPD